MKALLSLYNRETRIYLSNKITEELDEIISTPGSCRYNYKCHMNAVHEAIKKGDDFILMGFYLYEDCPIIHFYNYTNGKVVDNTLGVHTMDYKHYFYKRIMKEDFKKVDDIFEDFRDHIQKELPFKLRLFSNYIP